ncbi:MAG: hypothetical protein QOJ65_190 [Fimbriimonadaceae bacterium]|jgi:hypothetical protein|nr:hypothetical protein [Fimbriimonadaceae bacterium]
MAAGAWADSFSFHVKMSAPAKPLMDVSKETEQYIQMLRSSGVSEDDLKLGSPGLRASFEQEKAGYSRDGDCDIWIDGNTSQVRSFQAALGTKQGTDYLTERYDGAVTYQLSDDANSTPRIYAGDARRTLFTPVDLNVLTGSHVVQPITSRREQTKAETIVSEEYRFYDTVPMVAELHYDGDGTLKRVEAFTVTPGKAKILVAQYSIVSTTPSVIHVRRFVNDKLTSEEDYTLKSRNDEPLPAIDRIIPIGQKVNDLRLGVNRESQVTYAWSGSLPTIEDLKRRYGAAHQNDGAGSLTWPWVVGGMLIIVGGTRAAKQAKANGKAA